MNALKASLSHSPTGRGYSAISNDSKAELITAGSHVPSNVSRFVPRRLLRLSTKGLFILVCTVLTLPGVLFTMLLKGHGRYYGRTPVPFDTHRRLQIILPCNEPSTNLCKSVSSALALGFPAPVIVNWGKDYQGGGWHAGSHLDKIIGVIDYLDWAAINATGENALRDSDLVVVADSTDTWFQLPPDVLIKRYYEANEQAKERYQEQWKGLGEVPMEQTIIVSTQKKCFPPRQSGSILHCDSLPQSPLREDLYGNVTDKDPLRYTKNRPRYLNSGSMIGPVGDMRRYFHRVRARMDELQEKGVHLYSDQGIFAEILAEQEIFRQQLRRREEWDDASIGMFQEELDYRVGLDYTQKLFIPTVFEEEDGEIITLNNETHIQRASKQRGIYPARLHGVPDDIKNATNPLQSLGGEDAFNWGELPLYADYYTRAIPVIVHHNAHKDNAKARRYKWWDRTWFFPHLRALLNARIAAEKPWRLSTVQLPQGEVVYTALETYDVNPKPRLFREGQGIEEATFEAVCRSWAPEDGEKMWYDEMFRDRRGPL
ncbi:hypothetical protein Neosp_009552 [[Neocosmospora] mangrovei]